jgi:hypothetical protein
VHYRNSHRRQHLSQLAVAFLLGLASTLSPACKAEQREQTSALTLLAPLPDEELLFANPARASILLSWKPVPSATAYRVLVATRGEPTFQRRTTESSVVVRGLAEGRYSWCVVALPAPLASHCATFVISEGVRL